MPVQVVDVRGDALAPDLLVELERVTQRPPMLEGVKPTRRHELARGTSFGKTPCIHARVRFAERTG